MTVLWALILCNINFVSLPTDAAWSAEHIHDSSRMYPGGTRDNKLYLSIFYLNFLLHSTSSYQMSFYNPDIYNIDVCFLWMRKWDNIGLIRMGGWRSVWTQWADKSIFMLYL